PGGGASAGRLTSRRAAPRPQGAAQVRVLANDRVISEFRPGAGFQEASFAVPPNVFQSGTLLVTLESDSFSQPPDARDLGLQVDALEYRAVSRPVLPDLRLLWLLGLTPLIYYAARGWAGNAWAAAFIAGAGIAIEAVALALARVPTLWFAEAIFWALTLALVLGFLLERVLRAYTPALTTRTIRLLYAAALAAFAVRMVLASGPGFIVDTQDYVVWSYKTVAFGLGSAYSAVNGLWVADQSPGLVYLLHAMGSIYQRVFAPDFLYPAVGGDPALRSLSTNPAVLADPVQRALLRMPSLLADALTGIALFAAARKATSERRAWLVTFGFWFNPAVLWNGAYWGQMDAVHAFLILIVFLLLDARRTALAFFVFGAAALTKPQALIFGPLLVLWAWREARLRGLVTAALAGAAGAALVVLPMIVAGGGSGMLAYFADTVGHHPVLSANAHNLWWFLRYGDTSLADTTRVISGLPLSYRALGLLLFAAAYAAALVRGWRMDRAGFPALGAFIAFAFFMLPTEIHENYGYALLPLLALSVARDRTWLPFYLAVTLTMVVNYALSDPGVLAWLGVSDPAAQLALPAELNAAANTLVFAAWALLWIPWRKMGLSRMLPARNKSVPA
ncbi:MAG: glycosyltransferase 87 family protein, partial [Rudaea sp.]